MSNELNLTNTADAFIALINGMVDIRKDADMSDDEIADSIKASLMELMK